MLGFKWIGYEVTGSNLRHEIAGEIADVFDGNGKRVGFAQIINNKFVTFLNPVEVVRLLVPCCKYLG